VDKLGSGGTSGKLKTTSFLFFIVALVLAATDLGLLFSPLRLLKYIPILVFLLFLIKNQLIIKKANFDLIMPFIILISYNLIRISLGVPIKLVELVFIFSSISLFLVFNDVKLNLKFLNIICFIIFILIMGLDVGLDFSLQAFLRSETSTGETNMLPFFFGLFFLFFLLSKNYIFAFINFIFIILSFRRIVFLGILSCTLLYLLPQRLKILFVNRANLLVFNLLLIVLFFFISTGFFDNIVQEYTGISIGYFTQGRSTYFTMVYPDLMAKIEHVVFVGIGQGNLIDILYKHLGVRFLFHNDVFKLFVENGLIVFILFFHFLFKNKTINQLILCIFFNLLLITDNVLTYAPVLLLFLILMNHLKQQHKCQ